MDILLFLITVTFLASFKIGFLSAIIFAILLIIIGIMLMPLVLMAIVGLVRTFLTKTNESPESLHSPEGIKMTQQLMDSCKIIGYLLVIGFLAFYRGGSLLVSGAAGLGIYFFFSFFWGDLPFQKPKSPIK